MYTYKKGDFYDVLTQRVKKFLRPGAKSVTRYAKSAWTYWLKIAFLIVVIGYLHSITFWVKEHSNWNYLTAYLTGFISMSLFFNVLHDANHFECFAAPNISWNEVLSRIVGSNSWVKHEMIMTHHTFRHHAYTGNPTLDPER